jgi:magnesium transporter
MRNSHPQNTGEGAPATKSAAKPIWVDLLDPTPEEIAQVRAETGVEVPSRDSLEEIESSSRLRSEGRVLYLSMPLAIHATGFNALPLGFILSPDVLVTVRYSALHAFEHVEASARKGQCGNSSTTFAVLVDAMVDYAADMLEKLSRELSTVSAHTFGLNAAPGRHPTPGARTLRLALNAVGSAGDHSSRIRESLLGLQRIIGYVLDMADWLPAELKPRLLTARQDLGSLVDFESHLSGKTQFLLDAILGFINTEQNDIFRVLTIVSVVGIPPTLIASMYGMNFHDMPEYGWRYGYPYGLTLIAVSILLPVIWFKRRGWW